MEPPKPNDPKIPKPDVEEEPNPDGEVKLGNETEWEDFSLPSPSTIEFEIQELEKLVVLEPNEFPFKYKMVFKNVSLLTDLEKSASVIAQKKEGILDVEDARKELEYEDIVSREQLKTRLAEQIDDIIKKYVKPQFGNVMRDPMNDPEMMMKQKIMQDGNGEDNSNVLGLSLAKAVNAQGKKKPVVKVDTTSTP